jgi:FolB domain-containing protein
VDYASSDQIHIEQLEVFARVGVPADERANPQRVTINLTIWPKQGFSKLEDDIGRTTDYAEVCRSTCNFLEERTDNLIETLASALASHILQEFGARAVEIEVRKFVLSQTQYVSATVRREVSG